MSEQHKPSDNGKYLDSSTWEALKAMGYSDEELYADQPTGPMIFSYSRKQAIADGVLVDLSRPGFEKIVKLAGIVIPAAMTATAFAQVVARELTAETAWGGAVPAGAGGDGTGEAGEAARPGHRPHLLHCAGGG